MWGDSSSSSVSTVSTLHSPLVKGGVRLRERKRTGYSSPRKMPIPKEVGRYRIQKAIRYLTYNTLP